MIEDNEFIRMDNVPITKEEIRAVSIGKLQLNNNDIVVDVGCGSGGMTVEIAKRCKFVYGIDLEEDAINTTLKNISKFNINNTKILKGDAGKLLNEIKFNKLFVGGTKNIENILSIAFKKNIKHIVINTIVINNTVKICNILEKNNYNIELVNVTISTSKKIKAGYMMISKNPIYIIKATK